MKNLLTLIKDYEEYVKAGNSENLSLFAEWLKQKYSESKDYLSKEKTVNAVGPMIVASYLIGGVAAYADMWMRLAMKDEPISGQMDWSILKKVEEYGNPAKKEVIVEAIAERTSCVEAIKRLIRGGLLIEKIDDQDKRVKRISLTTEGTDLIKRLNVKMLNLGKLMMGTLHETEQKSLIPPLKKLVGFYENLNKTRDKADVKRIYGI